MIFYFQPENLKHHQWKLFLYVSILIALNSYSQPQTIYYVDAESNAVTPDGTSWETAFKIIPNAINQAVSDGATSGNPAEVWVAEGSYTGGFELRQFVHLYGGFNRSESDPSQRNWYDHQSIIDRGVGQTFGRVKGADNSTLDGFTISGGSHYLNGGGIGNIDASPRISNCLFLENFSSRGGAIYNENSSAVIDNCVFYKNHGSSTGGTCGGGAIYNLDSNPTITNCLFKENYCYAAKPLTSNGGAIFNLNSKLKLTGCQFISNRSSGYSSYGGAMYSSDCDKIILTNCEFYLNKCHSSDVFMQSQPGIILLNFNSSMDINACTFYHLTEDSSSTISAGAFENDDVYLYITNSIIWGDYSKLVYINCPIAAITYSCVKNDYNFAGAGNLNTDPLFIAQGSGNLGLRPDSPCIDVGTPENAPETDIRGATRPFGNGVDMGAYEMVYGPVFFSN